MVPAAFYDYFGLHLYFLFSSMSSLESSFKLNSLASSGTSKSKSTKNSSDSAAASASALDDSSQASGMKCMSYAASIMCRHSSKFWKLGVSDEEYVSIPTRISYQLLESAARPKAMKDHALAVVKQTIRGGSNLNTVVAALMDLMHSFEHAAPLVAEMCKGIKDTQLAEEVRANHFYTE